MMALLIYYLTCGAFYYGMYSALSQPGQENSCYEPSLNIDDDVES
jgi:hypothetical protein